MALGSLSPVRLDCLGAPPLFSLCLSPPRAFFSLSLARTAHTTASFNPLSPPSHPLAASSISSYTLLRFCTPFTASRQRNLCLGSHSSSLFRRSSQPTTPTPPSNPREPPFADNPPAVVAAALPLLLFFALLAGSRASNEVPEAS